MIQHWKKTGGFLEEGEQLNIPNEESSDEEEETFKQRNYLEIGSSTFKGKENAETGDLFEPKKRIYRKSTSGPSETLMIHEKSENPAEEYEEMSENEEATREANKDRLIIKALWEIVKVTKRKGITEGVKETRLVSFPTFSGGDQDPIEWIDAFDQACQTNGVKKKRKLEVAMSYLKGSALTWAKRRGEISWEDPIRIIRSFVHQFRKEYCGVYRKALWKQELKNIKQRSEESIEGYVARLKELWRRIDPEGNRDESDRIQEFIEGLRSEFIVQVQGIMPSIVEEAIRKAKTIEIALAMKNRQKWEQNNEVKERYSKKTNDKKKYEKSYNSKEESVEEIIRRVLKEKEQKTTTPTTVQCYRCGKKGHVKRECREEKKYIPTKPTTVKFTPTCYKCEKK